jgi:hypothetical protein
MGSLAGLAISGVLTILCSLGPQQHPKVRFYLALGLLCSVYFLVKCIAILYGLHNFNIAWREILDESIHEGVRPLMLSVVESELDGETSHYHDVIFTERYLIVFKKLGSFAIVRAITYVSVRQREHFPHGFSLMRPKPYLELSCEVEPLGRILLSTDPREMRSIIDEIFYRNSSVGLDEESIELLA